MKGFGTVVTGTVVTGQLGKDDAVVQFPQQRTLRIRGLQVHGRPAERVFAGQRAAINLAGVEKAEIARGDQLAAPDALLISYLLNVELRLLPEVPRDLTQRTRVRLHLGTSEVIGRLVLLERETFAPGETQLVQLRLESPLASRYGDRFIIRHYSPLYTMGGGRVIDPAPNKSRRVKMELATRLRALAGDDPVALTEQVIWLQSTRGIKQSEGFIRTGLSDKTLSKSLAQLSSLGRIVNIDPAEKKFIHRDTLERVSKFLVKVLEQFHRAFPEREGVTRAELAGKLATLYSDREVGQILARLVKDGAIEQHDQVFRNPGHEKTVSGQEEAKLREFVARIEEGGVQPVRRSALFETCGVDEKTGTRLLKMALHAGRLVRVKDDLYYTPETLRGIEAKLRQYLAEREKITVVDFKDLIGLTRKHAVDLLEHFDAEKVTIRLDNERILRQASS
jgi:selenocysteine-specific elongation factor